MKLEDLRVREWKNNYAKTAVCFFYDVNDKEFLEKNCPCITEQIKMVCFDYGEMWSDNYEDHSDPVYILECYHKTLFNCNYFTEVDVCCSEDEVYYNQLKKVEDFLESLEIKTVYQHKETKEVIDLSEYNKIKTVVIKENK